MSGRPGEWHLLGHGSDPVPGDVSEVHAEAAHYRGVAATITDQIAELRRLAQPDAALKGYYADALQDGMRDLADDLAKAENRFNVVASQLGRLAPELADAMRTTARALEDAVAAQHQIDANQPDGPRPPGAPELTPEQKDAVDAKDRRHDAGVDALSAARRRCDTAVATYDSVADEVARKIRDASDDDLKDSRWDKFKDLVHSISTKLDFLADLLGWIGTLALAVAIFIPGVNLVVLAAIALVALSLALGIHTLLAATGNGSWADVAFDALALVTMGLTGKAVGLAVKTTRAAALANGGRVAGRTAAARTLAQGSFRGGTGVLGRVHSTYLRLFSSSMRTQMRATYDDAFRAVTSRSLEDVATTVGQRASAFGEVEVARMKQEMASLAAEFGPDVVPLAHRLTVGTARGLAGAGVTLDIGQKLLEGIKLGEYGPLYEVPPYQRFKERYVGTGGEL